MVSRRRKKAILADFTKRGTSKTKEGQMERDVNIIKPVDESRYHLVLTQDRAVYRLRILFNEAVLCGAI